MKIKDNIALSPSGFLFNPSTGESFSLNQVGRDIIALQQEGKSMEELTSIMMDKYDVDHETLDRHLLDFTSSLRTYHLIEENEEN